MNHSPAFIYADYYRRLAAGAQRLTDDQLLRRLVRTYNYRPHDQEEKLQNWAEFHAAWDELAARWPSVFHA